jgi:membrane dipeptidase
MLLIDGHLDLSWNALQWNRDLRRSCYTLRAGEAHVPGKGRAQNTVAYPEMRQGRMALCLATVLARSTGTPVAHIDYASPAQAYGVAQGQLAYYRALEQEGLARIIADGVALTEHMAAWRAYDASPAPQTPPLGFAIAMEGADCILRPQDVPAWWQAGLRVVGITHYGHGRYADGTSTEGGLTELGTALLAEMQRAGMILDISHCSDQAFWQALERFDGAVLASHNNCRALVPHQRQFSDEQLRALFQRDGVIGAACDCWMLRPGWVDGWSNAGITLSDVADHIDHLCQLAGNSRHAAIGSDLDGGYGREQSPCDLDTIADLQKLAGILEKRGYGAADITAIMYGNWVRLLERAWA